MSGFGDLFVECARRPDALRARRDFLARESPRGNGAGMRGEFGLHKFLKLPAELMRGAFPPTLALRRLVSRRLPVESKAGRSVVEFQSRELHSGPGLR
jgi:hypothetical protein